MPLRTPSPVIFTKEVTCNGRKHFEARLADGAWDGPRVSIAQVYGISKHGATKGQRLGPADLWTAWRFGHHEEPVLGQGTRAEMKALAAAHLTTRRNPRAPSPKAEALDRVAEAEARLGMGDLQRAKAALEVAWPLIDRAYPAKWAADLLTRTAYARHRLERMGVQTTRETPKSGWKSASQGRKMNPIYRVTIDAEASPWAVRGAVKRAGFPNLRVRTARGAGRRRAPGAWPAFVKEHMPSLRAGGLDAKAAMREAARLWASRQGASALLPSLAAEMVAEQTVAESETAAAARLTEIGKAIAAAMGVTVSDARAKNLGKAREAGAKLVALRTLVDAVRVSSTATIILPPGKYAGLSRGHGWARMGQGDSVVWGESVDGGYRVGPGKWSVGSSDGSSRKSDTPWVVKHIRVGDAIWTVAS